MLSLPVELRIEIYNEALPSNGFFDMQFDCTNELRWLATSRALFEDAAPQFFTRPLLLSDDTWYRQSIYNTLDPYLRRAFGADRNWIAQLIRKMVRRIEFKVYGTEIKVHSTDSLEANFSQYAFELPAFPNLEAVNLTIYLSREHNALSRGLDTLRDALPPICKVTGYLRDELAFWGCSSFSIRPLPSPQGCALRRDWCRGHRLLPIRQKADRS